MSETKQPLPYDPKLIAEQCNPLALRLGCAAGCWKGENFKQCGRPPVAIRRWTRDDGYDDSEFLPKEGVYGPACKLHANHDVVPLSEVLKAVADAGCWKHDPSLMPPLSGVLPYDPMRVFALCDPSWLRLGCTAGVSRDGDYESCGKPVVTIRRWMRTDGPDCEDMPETGWYGPVCKAHASHDVVPLAVILDLMMEGRR
ncbi:hypothetical protein [Bifidobacterium longum]|uniref:hypothetical protein n=1 Tax=Bifidobacterium longum TaxID=216816 RepID=UPI0032DFE9C1